MVAESLRRIESIPINYPAVPTGLSTEAATLNSSMIWQRIEAYISHRFTDREVIWTVEGPGDWQPDLTPATVVATELWQSNAWASVTLEPSPMGGLCLPGEGPFRLAADVGGGTVPASVNEAFRRLAEYSVLISDSSSPFTEFSDGESSGSRSVTWAAKAMQNSGAGDLLRPYRRI